MGKHEADDQSEDRVEALLTNGEVVDLGPLPADPKDRLKQQIETAIDGTRLETTYLAGELRFPTAKSFLYKGERGWITPTGDAVDDEHLMAAIDEGRIVKGRIAWQSDTEGFDEPFDFTQPEHPAQDHAARAELHLLREELGRTNVALTQAQAAKEEADRATKAAERNTQEAIAQWETVSQECNAFKQRAAELAEKVVAAEREAREATNAQRALSEENDRLDGSTREAIGEMRKVVETAQKLDAGRRVSASDLVRLTNTLENVMATQGITDDVTQVTTLRRGDRTDEVLATIELRDGTWTVQIGDEY